MSWVAFREAYKYNKMLKSAVPYPRFLHRISQPRALVYHPQVNGLLEEAGVLDEIRKAGQHKVNAIVLKKYQEQGGKVHWNCQFQRMTEENSKVNVVVADSKGHERTISASFVLGADGGHSSIRKAIGAHLEGFTHELHMVSCNIKYDKIRATGFGHAQFLVDPKADLGDSAHAVIIYTGSDDVWRCAYVDNIKYTEDEVRARLPLKLKMILPLHPDEDQYELLMSTPYRVHNRCADFYTKGRVIIAGDAAHLNSPIGGIGLNTGLLDAQVAAVALSEALVMTDEAQVEQRLKKYADERREAFMEHTNPVTIDDINRVIDPSKESQERLRDSFFESLKDPEFQRKMQLGQNKMALGVPGLSVISQLTTSSTRADVLSWYVVFASLGSALGSEASGRMVHALSHRDGWTEVDAYHALFWLHTSVGALNAILVLGLSDACELRTEKTYAQLAQDEANQPTPQSTPTDTPNWKSKANSWFSSAAISAQTRSIMYRLWFLLSIDSLADGMVPYSLTNYYMDLKFHPSKSTLGDITSASYFLGAISSTFAGPLAKRIGLINTMVFTHVPSSAAVLLFPLPPVFWLTTFLLLIRTGLNPMDQAPRAAFIAAVVRPEERTACMGITTMVRISAAMLGPSITGGLAATNKFWIAYAVAGTCRLAYDFGLWALFVNMKIDQGEVKGDAGLGVVEGTELDEEENLELHSLPDFASSDNLDFEHRLAAKDNRGQNDG
ncbi:hypothetical protein R6Q59_009890 [Mikania micrantha]